MEAIRQAVRDLKPLESNLMTLNSSFEMQPFLQTFTGLIKEDLFTILFNEQLYKYLATSVENKLGMGRRK